MERPGMPDGAAGRKEKQDKVMMDALETTLGYVFENRALLELALTSPSYRAASAETCEDNQRLEFLGDAVLGLLAAEHLFNLHPVAAEGELTIRRSHLIAGKTLAEVARRIELDKYLRIGVSDAITGGSGKDRLLADALEAIFGAIWCDAGLEAVNRVFRAHFLEIEDAFSDPWANNSKGQLQEMAQRHAWPDSPTYECIHVEGPDHAPMYTIRVTVAGGYSAQGEGRSKRIAEKEAARRLLHILIEQGIAAPIIKPA